MAPLARGGLFCLWAARFFEEMRGVWESKRGACRLRGTCAWRAEFGSECAGIRSPIKLGDPDWNDARLLVFALACAA